MLMGSHSANHHQAQGGWHYCAHFLDEKAEVKRKSGSLTEVTQVVTVRTTSSYLAAMWTLNHWATLPISE